MDSGTAVVRTSRVAPLNRAVDTPAVAHLGPDLAAGTVELDAVLARLARHEPERPLVDVLLANVIRDGVHRPAAKT